MTAGAARPSLSPDSRLKSRYARHAGFVTTAEESTTGRGERSAPPGGTTGPAEVGQRVRHHGDEPGGERHGEHELAQRQVPLLLEQLRLDFEPVAEQDQDQGDDRERADEVRLGSISSTSMPPSPRTNPTTTKSAVSERKLRLATPRQQCPTMRSPPSTATATSNAWKSCTGVIFARWTLGHPHARRRAPPTADSAQRRRGEGRHDHLPPARRSTTTRSTSAPTSSSSRARRGSAPGAHGDRPGPDSWLSSSRRSATRCAR